MSKIVDARTSVAEVLNEVGLSTHPVLPERMNPPEAIVIARSPYITNGQAFGSYKVNLGVSIVVEPADNAVELDQLDNLIEEVISALVNHNHAVIEVTKPYAWSYNNAQYTAVDVLISNTISLLEE
jgi:hypothetical protein